MGVVNMDLWRVMCLVLLLRAKMFNCTGTQIHKFLLFYYISAFVYVNIRQWLMITALNVAKCMPCYDRNYIMNTGIHITGKNISLFWFIT